MSVAVKIFLCLAFAVTIFASVAEGRSAPQLGQSGTFGFDHRDDVDDRMELEMTERDEIFKHHRRRHSSSPSTRGHRLAAHRIHAVEDDYRPVRDEATTGTDTSRIATGKRQDEKNVGLRHKRMYKDYLADQEKRYSTEGNDDLMKRRQGIYEIEVSEAQNDSICNYTVESVPGDVNGTRIPKNLEHIRCNHLGSQCQVPGKFCCMQTYRNVPVTYTDRRVDEVLKVYVGCICGKERIPEGKPHEWVPPRINQ